MSQPVLECVNDWELDCLCGRSHMPCWPRPDTSCCSDLDTTGKTEAQIALIERMLHVSTEIMWRLSGKKYGACPVTVRPCRDDQCNSGRRGYTWWDGIRWMPFLENGVWFNDPCGTCPKSGCSCSELCEITLPGPVDSIVSVTVDGLPLDPSEYRVDNGNKLVRTSFGPLVMTQWQDLGGGVALATQSDVPAHPVTWSGGAVTTDGQVTLPSQPGPFLLNLGSVHPQQRVKLTLEPWAELTLPAGWTVLQIQPLGATSTVFQFSPTEVRGGQFGGWVIVTGPGQSPLFLLPDGLNGIGEPRGGAAVDYVSYVDDNRGGCWPKCQEMALPTTEAGTMAVIYRKGEAVPQGGLWAAGLLACQLIKACSAEAECALPSNAQRIVREGVTLDLDPLLIDATGFRTGIAEVDLWLSAVNPYRSTGPSVIRSPDTPRPRVTTWPCS